MYLFLFYNSSKIHCLNFFSKSSWSLVLRKRIYKGPETSFQSPKEEDKSSWLGDRRKPLQQSPEEEDVVGQVLCRCPPLSWGRHAETCRLSPIDGADMEGRPTGAIYGWALWLSVYSIRTGIKSDWVRIEIESGGGIVLVGWVGLTVK